MQTVKSKFAQMLNVSMPQRTVLQNVAAAVASLMVLSWLRIRPIGIFFLALFFFWLYKTRSNFRIVPPPELQKKYEQLVDRGKDLRKTNPTMFVVVASTSLGLLAIIGHFFSGSTVVLAGLSIAVIISTKFTVQRIDTGRFMRSLSPQDESEDDEFVPEVNTTNLALLERASDLTSHTSPTEDVEDEDKSDDIPSELLIPDSIPEISENSTDDDDDLIPVVDIKKLNADPQTIASKIHFRKGHFKSDSTLSTSSSSSEESLSKGLKFPDHAKMDELGRSKQANDTAVDAAVEADLATLALKSTTQSLLENSGKLLPNLVAGLIQWGVMKKDNTSSNNSTAAAATAAAAPQERPASLDSSDSDFEFLDNE